MFCTCSFIFLLFCDVIFQHFRRRLWYNNRVAVPVQREVGVWLGSEEGRVRVLLALGVLRRQLARRRRHVLGSSRSLQRRQLHLRLPGGGGTWRAVPGGEPLHLQLLRHREEGAQLVLGHVHLPVVHEVQHGQDLTELDSLQVDERVGVPVVAQQVPEEAAAGRQHHPVRLHLPPVPGGERHVEQLLVTAQLLEGVCQVVLKMLPLQTELLHGCQPGGSVG